MARNLMLRRDLDVGKPQRMRRMLEALELGGEWRQANVKSAQYNTTDNLPQSLCNNDRDRWTKRCRSFRCKLLL